MESVLINVLDDITSVFSDIDGTLAHYAETLIASGYTRLTSEESGALPWPPVPTTEVEELLARCFPPEERDKRFRGVPCQFWRHTETSKVIKTFELHNLSLTGAVISENTVLLVELLQQHRYLYNGLSDQVARERLPVLFTLITGARSSTYMMRRSGGSLPFTAYDACEGGGKLWCRLRDPKAWLIGQQQQNMTTDVFLPNNDIPSCDQVWLQLFAATTGYSGQVEEPKSPRRWDAPMWKVASVLEAQGFAIDLVDYDTSFLVNIKASPCVIEANGSNRTGLSFASAQEAETYIKELFASQYSQEYSLEVFVNLGKAQVNAKGSGKKGVMNYIIDTMNQLHITAQGRFSTARAVALFDDHNDLPFAAACGAGILPSVAHAEVLTHREWSGTPQKWFRPPFDGLLGSEWALSQIVLFKRRQ